MYVHSLDVSVLNDLELVSVLNDLELVSVLPGICVAAKGYNILILAYELTCLTCVM